MRREKKSLSANVLYQKKMDEEVLHREYKVNNISCARGISKWVKECERAEHSLMAHSNRWLKDEARHLYTIFVHIVWLYTGKSYIFFSQDIHRKNDRNQTNEMARFFYHSVRNGRKNAILSVFNNPLTHP